MQENILLLSIRPEYAQKIIDGTKTVELRRVRTRLKAGDLVLLYISSPEKALVGSFEVERVIEFKNSRKALNNFWNEVKNNAGIEKQKFDRYYQGASVAVGIFIKKLEIFPRPLELERLRRKLPNLKPPQSYRYLKENELEAVKRLTQ
ncbi:MULTISPECIES: ASCH domain-containing protein [Aerosakkonema]|uniref:ASCH domain-containing protein n=1 Tax=Aerosakkonema TaxID=1246629 RepID=UPI0035B6D62D